MRQTLPPAPSPQPLFPGTASGTAEQKDNQKAPEDTAQVEGPPFVRC